MMKKVSWLMTVVMCLMLLMGVALPIYAQDQVTVQSQPEEVAIFLNNIAYIEDVMTLPAGTDVQVILPDQIFPDTLILRENGVRVSQYRISRTSGQVRLSWGSGSGDGSREITLSYLMAGVTWKPTYDMQIAADQEHVQLDFFAEIQSSALALDNTTVRLVAGRVDTAQQLDQISSVTANQALAGYADTGSLTAPTGAVTIQHIYEPGIVQAEIGDTVYVSLLQSVLPARRILLWNANTDQQVKVIYKVLNESDIPLAEGIVRSYEDDLFVGSDFVEVTPVGSEGSVTVGNLQNVRVNRAESRTALSGRLDNLYNVELTLSNFGDDAVTLEVVDFWNPYAEELRFSAEPQRETNNVFRWEVTLEAGETHTITYEYKTE